MFIEFTESRQSSFIRGRLKNRRHKLTELGRGRRKSQQKRATKLVIKLKNKSYIDRLIYLNLPTLKYRRL